VIRIQVANAFADQPIDGNYVVEPMGTVALGPGYGRVSIAGLSILEAEDAIKRHLATMIENPAVQATMHDKAVIAAVAPDEALRARATDRVTQQLESLLRHIAQLEKENAKLKKQIEQKNQQPSVQR
jgi:hypothetical protein